MAPIIGFVGLGRMGGLMSRRLIDAGSRLCVFDSSHDAVAPLTAAANAAPNGPLKRREIAKPTTGSHREVHSPRRVHRDSHELDRDGIPPSGLAFTFFPGVDPNF